MINTAPPDPPRRKFILPVLIIAISFSELGPVNHNAGGRITLSKLGGGYNMPYLHQMGLIPYRPFTPWESDAAAGEKMELKTSAIWQ